MNELLVKKPLENPNRERIKRYNFVLKTRGNNPAEDFKETWHINIKGMKKTLINVNFTTEGWFRMRKMVAYFPIKSKEL